MNHEPIKKLISDMLGYTGNINYDGINIEIANQVLEQIESLSNNITDLLSENQEVAELPTPTTRFAENLTSKIGVLTYNLAESLGLNGPQVCQSIKQNEQGNINYTDLVCFADGARTIVRNYNQIINQKQIA